MSHYRKTMICELPHLSYLDDRPVFEDERRCAEAWRAGGLEARRQTGSHNPEPAFVSLKPVPS